MNAFLSNPWTKVGILLVTLGWGPLFTIILLSKLGMWADPNPNPIGCGLLFAITVIPAIICLGMAHFNFFAGGGKGAYALTLRSTQTRLHCVSLFLLFLPFRLRSSPRRRRGRIAAFVRPSGFSCDYLQLNTKQHPNGPFMRSDRACYRTLHSHYCNW
jgi:hypothetical protein